MAETIKTHEYWIFYHRYQEDKILLLKNKYALVKAEVGKRKQDSYSKDDGVYCMPL